jgi:ribosomal protein S18 acetylase RimI-like enzyme
LSDTPAVAVDIVPAHTPEYAPRVRELFQEFAAEIHVDLCFQDFQRELAELPGAYAPPAGRLFVARCGGELAGCVALRPIDAQICEMKRLYVRPAFRGLHLGRALASAIIAAAHEIGYRRLRLDTLATMTAAIGLYRSLGFVDIEPYCFNPFPGATFLELDLNS